MIHENQMQCPVCGMKVEAPERRIVYLQMQIAFCSAQCEARFLAHPHLYIGYPGAPAPKQEGRVVLKRRRLHLAQPLSVEGEALVGELLGRLMGVLTVEVHGDSIEIIYNLLQVSLEELERALVETGVRLGGEWVECLRRALIHGSEDVEIDAHEVTPPHHYRP